MSSKKSTVFSIEDFRKLSIREQIVHRQVSVKQVVKLKSDIMDRDKYLMESKTALEDFSNIIENNTPTFEKEGIYCTVDPCGHLEIDTDNNGLPSKKVIKELCAFLMKHFG
jgi:hypothetical protein